jgi:hypothetical protein
MATERREFKYRGRSDKTIHERANRRGGTFDSYTDEKHPRYKVRDGLNQLRILPWSWGDDPELVKKWGDSWGIELIVHNNVGPDKSTYLCNRMRGKRCEICETRNELADDDEEAAKEIKPGLRILAWVIDRDEERVGPQLYAMPQSKVEKELQARSRDKKTGAGILIDDPDDGFDISFIKEGSKLTTTYRAVDIDRDPTPLHDNSKTMAKWLDYIDEFPLPSVLKFYDNDYLESILQGKGKGDEEKDKDDEKEERSERKSRRSRDEDEDTKSDRDMGRRSRSRDDDGETEERSSRVSNRSRRDEPEEEERRPRRARDEEPEEEPRSRRSRDKEEEEPEERGQRTERSERRRDRDEPEERDERSVRRGRDRDEPEERHSEKRRGKWEDDEPEEKTDKKKRPKDDDDELGADARKSVERLKRKHKDD